MINSPFFLLVLFFGKVGFIMQEESAQTMLQAGQSALSTKETILSEVIR